jgi:hypothetical protein
MQGSRWQSSPLWDTNICHFKLPSMKERLFPLKMTNYLRSSLSPSSLCPVLSHHKSWSFQTMIAQNCTLLTKETIFLSRSQISLLLETGSVTIDIQTESKPSSFLVRRLVWRWTTWLRKENEKKTSEIERMKNNDEKGVPQWISEKTMTLLKCHLKFRDCRYFCLLKTSTPLLLIWEFVLFWRRERERVSVVHCLSLSVILSSTDTTITNVVTFEEKKNRLDSKRRMTMIFEGSSRVYCVIFYCESFTLFPVWLLSLSHTFHSVVDVLSSCE